MSIRAKCFWLILLTIGCAIAYRAMGVSQGDGARALVKKAAVSSLPPMPPDVPVKAAAIVIPPAKPITNVFSAKLAKAVVSTNYLWTLQLSTNLRTWTDVYTATNPLQVRIYGTNRLAFYRWKGIKK